MTKFFQRFASLRGSHPTEGGQPRLILAAFGKHPGWNDHIPGIGMETEALAQLKQAMYVTGIGGRIDSGAWKALDAEKRIEGFDHAFLSLQGNLVIAGRMNSSEDGLRRKEYPMVFCVEAEGFSQEMILTKTLPELERLREACRATSSADQVMEECRMAQNRLRDDLRDATSASATTSISTESRRRFVEHPSLGPERVGLLRILHELGSAGNQGAGPSPGKLSHHVRVPMAADSRIQSFLLWAGFLRAVIPASSPLLLISRNGVDCLDVIVGEPTSDDFFCLQAPLKALPVASAIPYDLTPELKPRLQEIETRFLRMESPRVAVGTGALSSAGTAGASDGTVPAGNASGLRGLLMLIVATLVVGAAVWLIVGKRRSLPEARPPIPAATRAETSPTTASVTLQTPSQSRTNAPALDESRHTAEAENKRRADEKRIAEEKAKIEQQARQSNQLKSGVEENGQGEEKKTTAKTSEDAGKKEPVIGKAGNVTPLPVEPKRFENDAAQAKAMENDADRIQIALGQGNYERAMEFCLKWPGVVRFEQLLHTVVAETNQLRQIKDFFQAGNYDAILTNRLPDKSKFTEIRTMATTEQKVLDQARVEFAAGDYTFLQRVEVKALASKLPFQKLVQDGGVENGQLTKAKQLQTENKPQAAIDFIVQAKLQKPPFVKIQQWASGELGRIEGEQRDSQAAKALFEKAEYASALELCRKYPGIAAFDALSRRITDEQKIFVDMSRNFSVGDYSFMSELNGRDYKIKPPFAELWRKGGEEMKTLGEFEKLQQANSWEALSGELNKLASDIIAKKPFADLRQWAQGKAREDNERKMKDPSWLDADFEKLLVWFNVLPPTHTRIKTLEARKQTMLGRIGQQRDAYLREVDRLEAEYQKGGWLNQNDRQKYLTELKTTIKYWE